MSATLTEGRFDLDGYVFGGEGDPFVVTPNGFDPGAGGWRTQDQPSPRGDSLMLGRDFRSPGTWSFAMESNLDDIEDALDSLETLRGKWVGDPARLNPGGVVSLRYHLAGRTRRVYGRPRKFAHDLAPSAWQGSVRVLADFQLADSLVYDDRLLTVTIPIGAGSFKGLATPMVEPLTTVGSTTKTIAAGQVGGTAPAPVTAHITGPITNPWIAGPGWAIHVNTTLSAGQSMVIDARPWAMTVLRNDGASLAGGVARGGGLASARLDPAAGAHFAFGGTTTGAPMCQFSWRPTYYSL